MIYIIIFVAENDNTSRIQHEERDWSCYSNSEMRLHGCTSVMVAVVRIKNAENKKLTKTIVKEFYSGERNRIQGLLQTLATGKNNSSVKSAGYNLDILFIHYV